VDELIGKQNRDLLEDYSSDLDRVASENTKFLEENIISQSLDLKDWMPQIQSDSASGVNKNKELDQSAHSRSCLRSFSLKRVLRSLVRTITGREYFEVIEVLCYPEPELLWGGNIESPGKKDKFHSPIIFLSGWVLGKTAPAVAVQIKTNDSIVAEMAIQISRPDVIKSFVSVPNLDSEKACYGFRKKLSIKKLPDLGYLRFQVVLADGNVAPLGFVQFSK